MQKLGQLAWMMVKPILVQTAVKSLRLLAKAADNALSAYDVENVQRKLTNKDL